jgi:putative spermidine/putrescine transport system permease protein
MREGLRHRLDRLSYRLAVRGLAGAALLILLGPIVIVLIVSLTDAVALKFPPPGYSLRWYKALADPAQSGEIQRAAWNSLKLALGATLLASLLGTAAALAIGRSRAGWARTLDLFFLSPLVLPGLAFGLAALMYFTLLGLRPAMPLLVIGHVVIIVPLVIRTTVASLSQLDPALLECSASLGAGPFYTWRRVTLPLIGPGIGAGAFLAFMASFDNIPVSLFLADARTEVLPMRMWGMLESRLDVRTAAVSGVITLVTLALLFVMDRLFGVGRQLR